MKTLFLLLGLIGLSLQIEATTKNYQLNSVDFNGFKLIPNYSVFGFFVETEVDWENFDCDSMGEEEKSIGYYFLRGKRERQTFRQKCQLVKNYKNYFISGLPSESNLNRLVRSYQENRNKRDLTLQHYQNFLEILGAQKEKNIIWYLISMHWHMFFNRYDNVRALADEMFAHSVESLILPLNFAIEGSGFSYNSLLAEIIKEVIVKVNAKMATNFRHSFFHFISGFSFAEISPEIDQIVLSFTDSSNSVRSALLTDYRWGRKNPYTLLSFFYGQEQSSDVENIVNSFFKLPPSSREVHQVISFLDKNLIWKNSQPLEVSFEYLKKSNADEDQRTYLDFISQKNLAGVNLTKKSKVPRDGFNQKRNYYKTRIEKNESDRIWSLYQLVILGDLNQSYL